MNSLMFSSMMEDLSVLPLFQEGKGGRKDLSEDGTKGEKNELEGQEVC